MGDKILDAKTQPDYLDSKVHKKPPVRRSEPPKSKPDVEIAAKPKKRRKKQTAAQRRVSLENLAKARAAKAAKAV